VTPRRPRDVAACSPRDSNGPLRHLEATQSTSKSLSMQRDLHPVVGGESPVRFSSWSKGTWVQAWEAPLDRDRSMQKGLWDVTNPRETLLRRALPFPAAIGSLGEFFFEAETRAAQRCDREPRGVLLSRRRPAQDIARFRPEFSRSPPPRAPRKEFGSIRQALRQGFFAYDRDSERFRGDPRTRDSFAPFFEGISGRYDSASRRGDPRGRRRRNWDAPQACRRPASPPISPIVEDRWGCMWNVEREKYPLSQVKAEGHRWQKCDAFKRCLIPRCVICLRLSRREQGGDDAMPPALLTALRDPRLSGGTDRNVALPMRFEENLQRRR
jgi:hypothetical protein